MDSLEDDNRKRTLLVRCHNVRLDYVTSRGTIQALADTTFHVMQGEFVCLVGPSGCGKSTLLKLLAELIEPTSGSIEFMSTSQISNTRSGGQNHKTPRSAMVFQEHGLFPWMTVEANVAFGLEMRGVDRRERLKRAHGFLAQIGLGQFARNYPHELSVGMRQRAAIARAFLTDSPLLLMDEPFSALDAQSKLILQEELLRIWKKHEKTVVYVTHDIEEAVLLADRVLVMRGHPGQIQDEILVPLGRPRNLADREQKHVREISWNIWKKIETDVRSNLNIPAAISAST